MQFKKPKTIYVHHSSDIFPGNQFNKINNYHKKKFNMKSSLGYYGGYSRLIEKSGEVKTYRADGEETIAQKGDNFEALSVCLAGNMNESMPTESQKTALLIVLNAWMDKYIITAENVRLHRDLNKDTECPGKNITHEYIKNLLKKEIIEKEEEKVVLLKKQINLWKKIVAILKQLRNLV